MWTFNGKNQSTLNKVSTFDLMVSSSLYAGGHISLEAWVRPGVTNDHCLWSLLKGYLWRSLQHMQQIDLMKTLELLMHIQILQMEWFSACHPHNTIKCKNLYVNIIGRSETDIKIHFTWTTFQSWSNFQCQFRPVIKISDTQRYMCDFLFIRKPSMFECCHVGCKSWHLKT